MVSQLDGTLSAPYTATFVPLHVSVLFLFPTAVSRQPANPLWFGLRKNFVEVLQELCPVLKQYLNVSWTKSGGDEGERLSEIMAKLKSMSQKPAAAKVAAVSVATTTSESKDYPYQDIMTPD